MHNLKAGAIYFALVFAVGWILGPIRQLLIVPHLGHITGLLLELPLMLVAMIFAARWVLRRPNVPHALRTRAQIGVVALGILLPAELAGALWVRGASVREYLASLATVSGLILAFAAVPALVGELDACNDKAGGDPHLVLRKPFPDQHDRRIGRLWVNCKIKLAAHLQHRPVLAQNLTDEFTDAALPCDIYEASHQQVSDTSSFPVAADGACVFGAQFVRIGKEMRDSERDSVELGQERQFPVVVELRQPGGNGVGKPAHRGKEPQPQILVAHMRREVVQQRLVLRTQRAHSQLRSIAQALD